MKNRFDYLPDFSPLLTIIEEGGRGELILHRKPKTSHPMDNFLEVVLVFWHGKFVVWNRNLQEGGFYDGAYFERHKATVDHITLNESYLEALGNYDLRGLETNLEPLARERLVARKQIDYLVATS